MSASRPHSLALPGTPYSFPSTGMVIEIASTTQESAGGTTYPHGHGGMSPPPTPLSRTLAAPRRHSKRPSIKFKISSSGSNIVNASVVDPAGRSLYSISSNSKYTMLLSCRNNAEVATVNWDRSSPRMVFRGKKMKCKDWLPLAGPDTEYVLVIEATCFRSKLEGGTDQISDTHTW